MCIGCFHQDNVSTGIEGTNLLFLVSSTSFSSYDEWLSSLLSVQMVLGLMDREGEVRSWLHYGK